MTQADNPHLTQMQDWEQATMRKSSQVRCKMMRKQLSTTRVIDLCTVLKDSLQTGLKAYTTSWKRTQRFRRQRRNYTAAWRKAGDAAGVPTAEVCHSRKEGSGTEPHAGGVYHCLDKETDNSRPQTTRLSPFLDPTQSEKPGSAEDKQTP